MENKIKEMELKMNIFDLSFTEYTYIYRKMNRLERLIKKIRQLHFWRSQLYSTFFKNTFCILQLQLLFNVYISI